MKSKLQTFLSFALIFAMIGSYFVSPNIAKVEAASKNLKITVPTKTIAVNTSITLKTNVNAKFKSSNKKIATVSSLGIVKGKKAGKATITVTSKANKNQKKTVKITVKNQLVITAPDEAKATLQVGEKTRIKTNLSSTYVSSDSNIAEVASNGTVTAKSAGIAAITVTSKKYNKLKKTVTITVTKPEEPTTEATTQQPASDDSVKPGNKPTTETPMKHNPTSEEPSSETPTSEKITEEPTSEQPTSEEPNSEEPTSEDPTPVDPTPEEKTLVGIEARYRGEKVPKGSDIVEQGLIITEKFSDGTNTEVKTFDSEIMPDISKNYTSTQDGGKEYQTYTVTYKGKTAPLKVEVVDVGDTLYPIQFMAIYKGKATDEIPKMEDISMSFVWSDKTSSDDVDTSKVQVTFFEYPEVQEIGYYVTYHYTFKDADDNDLYVCVRRLMYVPYE